MDAYPQQGSKGRHRHRFDLRFLRVDSARDDVRLRHFEAQTDGTIVPVYENRGRTVVTLSTLAATFLTSGVGDE